MPRTLRPPDTTKALWGLPSQPPAGSDLGFPAPGTVVLALGPWHQKRPTYNSRSQTPSGPPRLSCHHTSAVMSDQGPKDVLQPHSSSRNSLLQVHFPGPALCELAVPPRGRQQHLKLRTAVLAQQLLAVLAELLLLVPEAGLILLAG